MEKLVVCDFDGTLVGSDFQLPARAFQFAADLKEKGVLFTLATGRSPFLTQRFIDYLGIKIPVITQNGAMIVSGKETLFLRQFPYGAAKDAVKIAAERGLSVSVTVNGIDYAIERTEWFLREEEGFGVQYHLLSELEGSMNGAYIEKICIIDPALSGKLNEAEAIIRNHSDYTYVRYGNLGIEIMANDVNKAYGMSWLASYLGISNDNVIAIGDSENDVEMLHAAGIGAVVGNSKPIAKNAAVYTASGNYFEGVAEIIAHFC